MTWMFFGESILRLRMEGFWVDRKILDDLDGRKVGLRIYHGVKSQKGHLYTSTGKSHARFFASFNYDMIFWLLSIPRPSPRLEVDSMQRRLFGDGEHILTQVTRALDLVIVSHGYGSVGTVCIFQHLSAISRLAAHNSVPVAPKLHKFGPFQHGLLSEAVMVSA
jgi:hypothetical protein